MRKIIYFLLIAIFIIIVLYKGSIIRNKEKKEIVSISQQWDKNGKPVDIIIVKKGMTYCYEKVSGVVKDGRTIVAEVPPENILNLEPGQKFDSISYGSIKGRLKWISKERNIVTGLFKLALESEKDINLPEGSIVPLRIRTATYYDTIRVPVTSVIIEEDNVYCWVIENNRAVKRRVKLGLESDDNIQIVKGLNEGSKVCINGMSELNENDKVLIRKQAEQ
ncbi:MAG: hypothetical protein JW983_06685 [Elusimicrobia bacterium]|nr:hypothetical protein [Elusimicrobiota bacterium]